MGEHGSTAVPERMHASGTGAFPQLVRAHTKELLRFASKRLNDPPIGEDLVQITFLAAWEARGRFAQQSSPPTWLYSILKNKLADHYRRAYRDPVVHGAPEPDDERFDADGQWTAEHQPQAWEVDEAAEAEDSQKFLATCSEHLPAHWRATVDMKYLHDRDAVVICLELGITPTNY